MEGGCCSLLLLIAHLSDGMSRCRTACRKAFRPRGTVSFLVPTPALFVSEDSAAFRPPRPPPAGADRDSRPPELYLSHTSMRSSMSAIADGAAASTQVVAAAGQRQQVGAREGEVRSRAFVLPQRH